LPRPHGLAEGTQKVWKGGPGGKLFQKFPPWPPEAFFSSAPDYRLLKAEEEDRDKTFTFAHDEDGQRVTKYLNGQLVEVYQWLDFVRLAAFYDGHHQYEFAYHDGERTPFAMRRDDGAVAGLFYDQVGSLRVVADLDDNVIKEVLYDPFGGIIEDTNPDLRLPLGFAGGLHDRDLGFVRFGWRDYDVRTGRWTAPDPIGDKGGDPDWYGYCLDDPVNGVDPVGLEGSSPVPGVEFDKNGVPTGEVGLEPPDFLLDPVMDWVPAFPIGKASVRVGRATKKAYELGKELRFGKNVRIAPFGNRTKHEIGRYPHYHRRGVDPKTGQTKPGQGIGRHRPWEKSEHDSGNKDRF
jgi:RHS repeat-associated protein